MITGTFLTGENKNKLGSQPFGALMVSMKRISCFPPKILRGILGRLRYR